MTARDFSTPRGCSAAGARANHRHAWFRWLIGLLLIATLIAACDSNSRGIALTDVPGGDPDAGRATMTVYGCGSCHTIPGVAGANASVGPPLTDFARRQYIAGQLANNAGNLVYWIMNPQTVEPGTAMPDMGVTETDALNMAAYLATLK